MPGLDRDGLAGLSVSSERFDSRRRLVDLDARRRGRAHVRSARRSRPRLITSRATASTSLPSRARLDRGETGELGRRARGRRPHDGRGRARPRSASACSRSSSRRRSRPCRRRRTRSPRSPGRRARRAGWRRSDRRRRSRGTTGLDAPSSRIFASAARATSRSVRPASPCSSMKAYASSVIRAASAIASISASSLTRRRSATRSSAATISTPSPTSSSSFPRDLTLVFASSRPTRPASRPATAGSISADRRRRSRTTTGRSRSAVVV